MNDITLQELILAKYAGSLDQASIYFNLAIQTGAVLISGIILWRMSVLLHKRKKAQRQRNNYFETPYAKGWKRK